MKTIKIARNNELKLTIPFNQITIKADGTIWKGATPLLGVTDPAEKKKNTALLRAGKVDQIPAKYFTRMGDNENGLWVGTDEEWEKHPGNAQAKKEFEAMVKRDANRVTIMLSTRGWGDYSPLEVEIDITRPDCEIIADCRKALEEGHDVDRRDQSDEEILKKVNTARQKLNAPAPQKTDRESAEREIQRKIKAGYCFSCESYCHGDCGNYSSDPATMYRRKLAEAAREANFGIRDN
jgi:hypothetical protein